ncbi:MAG: lipopolysaccharide biosynthesis protein [Prevotellaceae bacterium]|nr:lipopolysaccharide biosynthesis protein [Candidatus Minthosoma caballi]
MSETLNKQVKNATKWSAITEIAAKLVTPVTTMVLARLLAPEAFGVLVTATLVISFAEIFTDAGFQKYIIQNKFEDDESLFRSSTVAFWTNLGLSLFLWAIFAIFSPQIARMMGEEKHSLVIAVSCVCIPIAAFSSIQMAIYKRFFDFRTLFVVRIAGILVPLIITIPIAYFTRSYWSLIVGMIAQNLLNAIILTAKSRWKPTMFYSCDLFKSMFSFTSWSLIEAISIWFTSYIDVFFVGSILSTYYMGIYRTSIGTVGQIMNLIIAATTPVLFSALSRLQDNPDEFKLMFLRFQKIVGLLVVPIGVGIFLFSDTITNILLGDQWTEASGFIGWWGLTSSVTIILSHYSSEIYRSLGKPKLSVLAQCLHLVVLIPVVLIAIQHGFETLYISRSLIRFQMILVNAIIIYNLIHISFWKMMNNIKGSLTGSVAMVAIWLILPSSNSLAIQILYVCLCSITYIATICIFSEERNILLNLKSILKKK